MSKLPFINLTFEDTSTSVDIDDTYIINDSITFDYVLLNKLKPASNKLSLSLTKNCPYIEQIINAKKDIDFILYLKEGANKQRLFTGYLTNKFTWSVGNHGESVLNISVEDVGTRLLKKTWNTSYKYISGKVTEVLDTLCAAAKISRADAIVIDTQVSQGVKKETKFEDLFKSLLEEVGYTYYFNEAGKLALEKINTTGTADYVIDKTSLYAKSEKSISVNKDVKQYGKVSVDWKEYETKTNTLIYEDISGRDESHPGCKITMAPHSSYPSKDGKPAFIEVKDIISGKEVITYSNIKPTFTGIGASLTHDIQIHDDKSLSVLVKNPNASEAIITTLKCAGDLIVVKADGTSNDGVDAGETLKVESKWLHDKASNDAYASFLANYYTYCNHSYTFYTTSNMNLGSICTLKDETFSGLNTKILLTSKKWKLDGMYEYKGVAIQKFDINDPTGDIIQRPDTPPGPIGPTGNSVTKVVYHYQVSESSTIAPTTWESEIPEFTPTKRYLWQYSTTYFSDGTTEDSNPGVVGSLGIDGKAPVVVSPSFDSMTIPAKNTGEVSAEDLAQIACEVIATQDNVALDYSTSTLQKGQYNIVVKSDDITDLIVDASGLVPTIRPTKDSVMLRDLSTIKVKVNYKDFYERTGNINFSLSISKSKQGTTGGDGLPGKNGVSVSSIKSQYQVVAKDGKPISNKWIDTIPSRGEDQILWVRDYITYSDNTYEATTGRPVTGDKGTTGDNGISVTGVKAQFQVGDSAITAPTGKWEYTVPSRVADMFLWTRDEITYSSGNPTYTTPRNVTGDKGDTGKEGKEGQFVAFQYYLSTSEKKPEGGTWLNDPVNVTDGKYLWMRTQTVPAGGSINPSGWGTPVLTGTDISKIVADVKTVDDKVTANTAAIIAQSDSINSTVDEVTKLGNTVTSQGTLISQTKDQIFLSVNRETNEVSNSAGIRVGWLNEDQTQIQLDADYILLNGSVKAEKIDTTDLLAKEIIVKDQGTLRSEIYRPDGKDPRGFELNHDGTATFLGMKARSGQFENISITGKSTFSGDINSPYFEVRNEGAVGTSINADSSSEYNTGWTDAQLYSKMYNPTPWLLSDATAGSTFNGTSVTTIGLFSSSNIGNTRTISSVSANTGTWKCNRSGTYRVSFDKTTYDWTEYDWKPIRTISKITPTKPTHVWPPSNPKVGDTYSGPDGNVTQLPSGDYSYDWTTWRYSATGTGTSTSSVYVYINGKFQFELTSGNSKSIWLNNNDTYEFRYVSVDTGTPKGTVYEVYSDNWLVGLNFGNANGRIYTAYEDTSIRSNWFDVNGNTPRNTGTFKHLVGIYQGGVKLNSNQVLDFKTPNTNPASSNWPVFNYQLQSGSGSHRFSRLTIYRSNGIACYRFDGPDGVYDTKDVWYSSYNINYGVPFSTPAGVYIKIGALRGDTQGNHTGNVNSSSNWNSYKVWGAVAN